MQPHHEHLRSQLAKLTAMYYRQAMPLRHLHKTGELLPECNGQEKELIRDGLAALREELNKQYRQLDQLTEELNKHYP